MNLIVYLIILVALGFLVGLVARLLLPGPDPMSPGTTTLVGIGGTFLAGLFSWLVLHRHGWGLLLSVLFSMLVLWFYRRSRMVEYRSSGPRTPRPRSNSPSRNSPRSTAPRSGSPRSGSPRSGGPRTSGPRSTRPPGSRRPPY